MRHLNRKLNSVQILFFISILEGLAALLILFLIPPDPKNSWLFGYSKSRWSLLLVTMMACMGLGYLSAKAWLDKGWLQKMVVNIDAWISSYGWFFILSWMFFILGFFGPFFYLMFTPTTHLPITRLAPLIVWGTLVSLQILVVSLVFKTSLTKKREDQETGLTTVVIRPKTFILNLGGFFTMIVILSLSSNLLHHFFRDPKLLHYIRKLYLNYERSIPTYLSSILLLLASILISFIAIQRKQGGKTYATHWASLAVLFVLLSMDEVAGIHEMMNRPMRLMFDPQGVFTFAWVIMGIPLVIILGILYARFIIHLPNWMKLRVILAAVLYIGGALGFEMLSAGWFELYDNENIPYILLVTVEETLEISGMLVFVYALLRYIRDHYSGSGFLIVKNNKTTNL